MLISSIIIHVNTCTVVCTFLGFCIFVFTAILCTQQERAQDQDGTVRGAGALPARESLVRWCAWCSGDREGLISKFTFGSPRSSVKIQDDQSTKETSHKRPGTEAGRTVAPRREYTEVSDESERQSRVEEKGRPYSRVCNDYLI